MANVYAHMQFTDPSGEPRAIGDQFDLPRETDQDKAEFARLKSWGVIGDSAPAGTSDDEQRTPARDRRKTRSSSEES